MMQLTSAAWRSGIVLKLSALGASEYNLPAIHLIHSKNSETGYRMFIFDSIFENKRHLQLDPILGDLSIIIDQDFLILDPRSFDILKSFMSANNSCLDCIIETLCRRRFDFSDPCD
jgi:hypothetical protein